MAEGSELLSRKKRRQSHKPSESSSQNACPVEHLVAIKEAVCHLVCRVSEMRAIEGQWLCTARIKRVFVRPDYWNGKVFIPQEKSVPPFLSFIGSQKFGYVHAAPLPKVDDTDGLVVDADEEVDGEEQEASLEEGEDNEDEEEFEDGPMPGLPE